MSRITGSPLLEALSTSPDSGITPIVVRPSTSSTSFTDSIRSEEHTSELQSLMRISYAVFCLKKKTKINKHRTDYSQPHKYTTNNMTIIEYTTINKNNKPECP